MLMVRTRIINQCGIGCNLNCMVLPPEEVDAALSIMLSSPEFRNATQCATALRALHKKWTENPTERLSDIDLAKALRFGTRNKPDAQTSARVVVSKLKAKLATYNAKHPGSLWRFGLSTSPGYRLVVLPHTPSEDLVPLLFSHRAQTLDWFRDTICSASDDILFVTVASNHTITRIFPWFDSGIVAARHFRVLTWRPKSKGEVAAFAANNGERKADLLANIDSAWASWKRLEVDNECVEVYGYTASPTLQALCGPDAIKVELLLFNRAGADRGFHECGSPDRRPALFLKRLDHPAAYSLVRSSFEDLWWTAMSEAKERDVHQRWRASRKQRLAERKLLSSKG